MTDTFFTSDLHFGHKKLVELRGFTNADEMDTAIINVWNKTISDRDEVYILGDFSFRNKAETELILDQLNGNLHLINGNHDKVIRSLSTRFIFTKDYHEFKHEDPAIQTEGSHTIVMSHYPFIVWNKSHYGSWSLHGHSHGSLDTTKFPPAKRMDVGIDTNKELKPYSYKEVAEYMSKIIPATVDNHTYVD